MKPRPLVVLFFLLANLCLAVSGNAQSNGLWREVWLNVTGSAVADLTNAPTFPYNPSFDEVLTNGLEAPTDVYEDYGQRLRALLIAPLTGNGSLLLAQTVNGQPRLLDYLNYSVGRAYGDYPDANVSGRQLFSIPTPGATNNPAGLPLQVFINEWMAENSTTLADPADGQFEDWFELCNAGTNTPTFPVITSRTRSRCRHVWSADQGHEPRPLWRRPREYLWHDQLHPARRECGRAPQRSAPARADRRYHAGGWANAVGDQCRHGLRSAGSKAQLPTGERPGWRVP